MRILRENPWGEGPLDVYAPGEPIGLVGRGDAGASQHTGVMLPCEEASQGSTSMSPAEFMEARGASSMTGGNCGSTCPGTTMSTCGDSGGPGAPSRSASAAGSSCAGISAVRKLRLKQKTHDPTWQHGPARRILRKRGVTAEEVRLLLRSRNAGSKDAVLQALLRKHGCNRTYLSEQWATIHRLVAKSRGEAFGRAARAAALASLRDVPVEGKQQAVMALAAQHAHLLAEEGQPKGPMLCASTGKDKHDARVRGVLLTWNGNWLLREPAFRELAAQAIPDEAFQSMLGAQPEVEALWKGFMSFVSNTSGKFGLLELSVCMELSTHSDERGRIHFHAYVSCGGLRVFPGWLRDWIFDGSVPLANGCAGGRRASAPMWQGHYYCQVVKIGMLRQYTNYPAVEKFVIEPRWVIRLWAQRKLSRDVFVAELLKSRMRVRGIIAELEWQERQHRLLELQARQARIRAEIQKQQKPFKNIWQVEQWKQQYPVTHHPKVVRLEPRYKFLVLNGPSRLGKSEFGRQIFRRTLTVECANVEEPRLLECSPDKFDAIAFEEASWRMAVRNKALFQAGTNVVFLGQSRCQEHSYPLLLHAVPLVIMTNDWLQGATESDVELVSWCRANSVVVNVSEPLWVEPDDGSLRLRPAVFG